jgi:hypothetical protein
LILALLLCVPCVRASAVVFLQDGNGYWWDFDPNGAVRDGSNLETETADAFDMAMRLAIFIGTPPTDLGPVTFPAAAQTTALGGRVVVTGPATMSGLNVTRRAYVPATPGEGWACFMEYLENPSGAGIAVTVRVLGNVGADGNTTVTASSSGDTVFTTADRWVASDDANNGAGDPSLNFNYWGVGASVTPTAVLLPASQDDYYVDFPVIVPANSTVILMHFCGQNANDAAASANAAALDALPAAALAGLAAAPSAPVINWNLSADVSITPTDLSLFSGPEGGAFTPASYAFTITNDGASAIDWSSEAPSWLDVAPASGTGLAGGGSVGVTVSLDTTAANAMSPGVYSDAIVFTDETNSVEFLRNAELTIGARVEITPTAAFETGGPQGGPFSPAQTTYTLSNVTESAVNWSLTGPAWLDIDPSSGTLAASPATVEITVSIDTAAANAMAVGGYSDVLTFSNDSLSPAITQERVVKLFVEGRMYVDGSLSSGANNGSSWANALHGAGAIQDAIDAAAASHSEVWVAEGVYTETVVLANGVKLYGGFANGDGMGDRDPAAKVTVLDADGTGTVVSMGAISGAGVDGFTITGGHGAAGGGGVRCAGSDSTCFVRNCYITNNRTAGAGGGAARGAGIYCLQGAAPEISDCWIVGNIIDLAGRDFGGGICCAQSEPAITDCVIAGNEGRFGAGVGCIQCAPTITNCIISGNLAWNTGSGGSGGGGVFAHNNSSPVLVNCVISGNYARDWAAGGLFCQTASDAVLTNCTIAGNGCNTGGGGIVAIAGTALAAGSAPVLTNCILDGMINDAVREGNEGSPMPQVTVSNCLFSGNAPYDFLDNGSTGYLGGDAIDANVAGAHDNVPGNPAPQFTAGITGVWSTEPVYDAETNRTALSASGSPFTGDLAGRLLNADTAQVRQALIVSNTADTLYVAGDITAGSGPLGYASTGDEFRVLDYHLNGNSPAVNVADAGAPNMPAADIEGNGRAGNPDLGAYECAAPSGVTVVSIAPEDEVVTSGDTVEFIVTFSRGIVDLEIGDFLLTGSGGQADAAIGTVTGSGNRWIVTVLVGSSSGNLHLDLIDHGTITDVLGFPLAGGDFTSGTDAQYQIMPAAGTLMLVLVAAAVALSGAGRLAKRKRHTA